MASSEPSGKSKFLLIRRLRKKETRHPLDVQNAEDIDNKAKVDASTDEGFHREQHNSDELAQDDTDEATADDTTSSFQHSSSTLETSLEPPLQLRPNAHIFFKAPDQDRMQCIVDEIDELKTVSFLKFDLENDVASCTVKMRIFKRCAMFKDFYKCVVQFVTYPHLLTAITTNMVDVTVEMLSTKSHPSPCENPSDESHVASICFQALNPTGLNAVIDELEPLKPISSLKFDMESHGACSNVTMVIERCCTSAEGFFSSVIRFPTYVHLMKAIVDNMVDVKIQISSSENDYPFYETVSILSTSEEGGYLEARSSTVERTMSSKTKRKRRASALWKFFSSLRHSNRRNHKKK